MTHIKSCIKASPCVQLFYREWLLDPQRTDYHLVFDQSVSGDLNLDYLKQALDALLNTHILFRSHLINKKNTEKNINLYWQENISNSPNFSFFSLECFDFCDLENSVKNYLFTPFDLEKGPLYRFCIFSDALKKEHRLFLIIHHVLLDGLSFKDFINTISQNYKNIKNKTGLVTHKITSEISEDLDLKAQLLEKKQGLLKQYQPEIFWAEALKNLPESNQLPYSRSPIPPIPAGPKPGVKSQRFDILINSLTPAFNNYATHNLLLLTWGVLIARYCHLNMPQQAAYISYPVSINKEERGLGFGAQINSLMMPIRLSRTKNFKDLYQEANNLIQQFKINNNLKYSDYPIDQILQAVFAQEQQKLKLNIGFAQTDLKNRCLDFSDFTKIKINHDYDDIDIAGSELVLEYDLYSPASGVINFRLRYRTDLFQEWQINLLIEQYRNLLNAILKNPEAPLISHSLTSSLPLQESREREGQKNNIIDLFESYASDPIHSARLALISYQDDQFLFGQKSYSYQELNQKSNQLARYIEKTYLNLTGQSIPPEILIPLIAERSIEMIIAILAILKTGGAYVPINPSYPKERIDFILKDTKARLVLADSQERIQDSSLHRSLINVDQYDLYAHESPENLGLIINPKNLAYVIYTSGTTGQPKGVMVEHHSVINLVKDSGYMTVNSQDVFMHISDPSFDAAVFEIWGALLNGALLFLPKSGLDLLGNPNFFKNYLIQNKISVLLLTKTLFDYFYQADQDLFASLTYLLVGGEALNAHLIQKLCQQKSQPKYLLNAYGPTEATTCSAIYHCQEKSPYASSYQIPIGKPFNRISIYVLDTYLQEVPVGTVGDLYIAGEGLARGYLNQEKLTAEKFITHILKNQKTPKKLYKTGDLARFLPDGNLEFFGRKDAQVKIRGHRIELSEIELVLTQHPKIKQAAVLLKTQKNALSDYLYLAAYYVLKNPGDPDNLSINLNLNNDLAKLLPDYMIPSIFILIDQLPMMPNGKLNFRLLPEPDFLNSLRSPGQIFKTPVEQEISKIWASILGLPDHKIQSNDHFFRLGGDSILSIQLSAALSSHGYACQVRDIYQNPELNKLADYLVRASSNSLNNSSYLISEKTSPVLITQMTYMQQYFFQYACGEKEKFGVLFPLIFTGDLDLARLKKAVQNILEIQDAFSLIYQKQGNTSSWVSKINQNNLCQFIQEPSPISLTHLVSKLELLSDTINIQTGPALIIYICKVEGFKQEQIIVITHHLYLDRTSLGIFKNQLNYFYNHKKYPLKTYSFLSWANDLAHYVISQKEREKINELWGCKLNNLTYSDGFFMDQGGFNLLEDRPENYGTMAFYLDLNFIQEAEKIRQKLPLFNLLFLTLFLTSYFLNLNKEKNKTIAIDNVFLGRDLQGKIAKESLENTMGWLATNLPVRLDFKDFDLKSLDQDLILNLNTQLLDITQPGHDLLYSMAKARTDLGFNLIGKSKALFNYYNRESDQRELEKEPEENEFFLSSIHSKIPMMYLEQVDYKLALTVFKNKKEIGFNLYFNRMNYTDQSMMDFIEIYKNTAGNLIKLMTESKSNVLA